MLSIRPLQAQRLNEVPETHLWECVKMLFMHTASLKIQYGDLIEQPFYQVLVTRGHHKFLDIM